MIDAQTSQPWAEAHYEQYVATDADQLLTTIR